MGVTYNDVCSLSYLNVILVEMKRYGDTYQMGQNASAARINRFMILSRIFEIKS